MIVPTRVLKKVMRSLLKRSQRYSIFMLALPLNILFHLLTVLLLLQSLPLRFQRKKAAVMKIVKRKVTNRLKLPTKNWHRTQKGLFELFRHGAAPTLAHEKEQDRCRVLESFIKWLVEH